MYHYLNGSLGVGVRCYAAVYQGKPIAFIAVACVRMKAKYYRVSRLVVLPNYQGISVGKRLLNFIAELYTSQTKMPFYILTSNPQIIRGKPGKLEDNSLWTRKQGKREHKNKRGNQKQPKPKTDDCFNAICR